MMAGFGGAGMAVPWLFGVITVTAIWVGVWWLLAALGLTADDGREDTLPAAGMAHLPPSTWQQPRFTAPEGPRPTQPVPDQESTSIRAESDYR